VSDTLPPIEELIPHRGGMLLVERVLGWRDDWVAVSATPQPSTWYAEAQGMPSWIGIELIAQAVGAHVGLIARSRGEPPKKGVLLGTRAYRSRLASFPFGAPLRIEALLTFRDETGLGSFDGSIALEGAEVAKASLTVYEPEDFDAFLAQASAAR
jgi:predicted hotdog family 3-hydroxylacyl-ACP dehydratase